MKRVAIIGGGAAGMFCAANIGEGIEATLFEASATLMRKVLLSGGGRCNFSNENIDTRNPNEFYPRGAGSLRKPFRRFGAKHVREFFESLGVETKTEDGGRMFPACDDSRAIAAALFGAARRNRVRIECNARVSKIERTEDGRFAIEASCPSAGIFDAVLVAVGGNPSGGLRESLEKFGVNIMPTAPSLFSLKTDTAETQTWRDLAGASIDGAELSYADPNGGKIAARGSLLFTHFGIGGPATLKFSSFGARLFQSANYRFEFSANFAPNFDEQKRRAEFVRARAEFAKRKISNAPLFGLPQKFWSYAVERAGISGETTFANLGKNAERSLCEEIFSAKIRCVGKSAHKAEFVSCGGVDRLEIDFSTMVCKKIPNLFFAGECIDIDAITGGFNLQAAWTTGKICAESLGKLATS